LEDEAFPSFVSYELEGIHVLHGYVVKGRNMVGTLSSIEGQSTGVRIEVNLHGIDPETVLIQGDRNLVTVSASVTQFVRVGCPDGVEAKSIKVWPSVNGILMMDCP